MRVQVDTNVVSVAQISQFLPTVVEARVPALGVFADNSLLVAFDARLEPVGDAWEKVGGAMAADLPNPNSLGLVEGIIGKNSVVFSEPKLWKAGCIDPQTGYSDPCMLTDGDRVVVVHALSRQVGFFGSEGYQGKDGQHTLFIEVAISEDRGKTWVHSDTSATVYGDFAGIFATSGHGVVISYECGQTWVVPLVARRFDGTTTHLTMRSADRGLTWVPGIAVGEDMDETAYGLLEGKLVLSARRTSAYKTGQLGRFIAVSDDAGLTWSQPQWDESLPAAACNAALVTTPMGLVFAYPGAGRETGQVALKRSLNGEWEYLGEFTAGPCGYIEGAWVDGKLLLLYEVPAGIRASLIAL